MKHNETNDKIETAKTKPFPWRCPRCLQKTVEPATISYAAKVSREGQLYEFDIPNLEVQKCSACGEVVFSHRVDDQIREALENHIQLAVLDNS